MTVQEKNSNQIVVKETKRLYYLDHLRVTLTLLVVAHHASQAYAPLSGSWPISNPTKSEVLDPFQAVNAAFFMGLFFLIAAYFVPGALERKGTGSFVKARFIRLGIPAVFFAVFIFGPIAYFSMGGQLNLVEFVTRLYRDGWQNLYNHLWFLLHLLLYSVVYVLWRLITKCFNFRTPSDRKIPWHAILLFFVVIYILFSWIVRTRYTINQWEPLLFLIPAEMFHLPQYVIMFVLGILAYRFKALDRLPTSVGLIWLGIGVISAGWFYVDFLSDDSFMRSVQISGMNLGSLAWSTWEALVCVGLGVGLLTLYREWINKKAGRLMMSITRAQYGTYIIHLLVVLGVQAGLASLPLPPFVKFVIATIIAAMLSFGISHLVLKIPGLSKII